MILDDVCSLCESQNGGDLHGQAISIRMTRDSPVCMRTFPESKMIVYCDVRREFVTGG